MLAELGRYQQTPFSEANRQVLQTFVCGEDETAVVNAI